MNHDHEHDRTEPAPETRIERHEVTERTEVERPSRPAATPMWVWVLPLVIVVIVLVWYILSTGEPSSPAESLPSIDLGLR